MADNRIDFTRQFSQVLSSLLRVLRAASRLLRRLVNVAHADGGLVQSGRLRQEHHGQAQQEHSVGKGVIGSCQLRPTGARAGKLLEHPQADGRDRR